MPEYLKGTFKPTNPSKYTGTHPIIYRSSWERRFMKYLDETPGILEWKSESIIIPYLHPLDCQQHRYFPDFWYKAQTNSGIQYVLVEIKPEKQTVMPDMRKRKSKKFLSEAATVAINHAKWQAAEAYAKARGWKFLVLTERHLFNK